jgi:inositol oxygenase
MYQTFNYSVNMNNKYCKLFNIMKMDIWEAINKLENIVDKSDPDLTGSQLLHALQTAEKLRNTEYGKKYDWLSLVGLIHDLGKVLALPEFGSVPQYTVVGDTFPLGCKFSEKIVYYQHFSYNFDVHDNNYNTKLGIYDKNCGFDNVLFSFGHDEYMYQVCKHNKCLIPEIGLRIIRYHSFYAWHNQNEYQYLMDDNDKELLEWIHIFNSCDLYSKDDTNIINLDNVKIYYQDLIQKYFVDPLLCW